MGWLSLMALVATAAATTAERVNWAGEDAVVLVREGYLQHQNGVP